MAKMRDHLKRVLELAKPYRGRLILGLLCGFLSGALAPTLGLSLKLAVDAVFPLDRTVASTGAAAVEPSGSPAAQNSAPGEKPAVRNDAKPASNKLVSRMPT